MTSESSIALVTGASSGIGEAICRLLVSQQCRVIGAARNYAGKGIRISEIMPGLVPTGFVICLIRIT